jgi:hypothetical protein
MNDMTCVRCKAVVSPQLIDFLDDGAVCRSCIIKAQSDPAAIAKGERDLMRSMGRRNLLVGLVMVALGITVLALGVSGGSLVIVPTGLLLGGLVELARGATQLSG